MGLWNSLKERCRTFRRLLGSDEMQTVLDVVYLIVIIFAFALLVVAWMIFMHLRIPFVPYTVADSDELSKFGSYMSGAAGAAFGFLSFVALMFTLSYQRRQYAQSNKVNARQIFDSAFFPMLSLHHEIVAAISYSKNPTHLTTSLVSRQTDQGRACFAVFFEELKNELDRILRTCVYVDYKNSLIETYERFYGGGIGFRGQQEGHGDKVGNYFRHLYRIYKLIDETKFDGNPKKDAVIKQSYSGIVRAQLSNCEILLLFYNGIGNYGTKFKPLIEKYAVLEHMPSYVDMRDRLLYSRKAYGDDHVALGEFDLAVISYPNDPLTA